MKKLLAMLLALGLMMTGVVVSAEPEEAALPAVGEVVHGFEVKEIRDFPLIDAQAVLFEHQKTGAELIYIANDDINRVFDLTFFTDAVNKTGLPHVFEHSTLSGSEKYPSKALFFNLSYQTYNTFMNAFTMDRMTSYPVASLSEAQLLNTPVPRPPATMASGNFTVLILSHCANALSPRITPALFRSTEVRASQS